MDHLVSIIAADLGVTKLGKRKVKNEGNLEKMVLPASTDVLGMADKSWLP